MVVRMSTSGKKLRELQGRARAAEDRAADALIGVTARLKEAYILAEQVQDGAAVKRLKRAFSAVTDAYIESWVKDNE